MTSRFRAALLAIVSVLYLASCGATFRPIATPISSGGGDPQSLRHAIVISRNGTTGDGAVTHVNISGDTNAGQVPVGQDPVHAALSVGSTATYIANRALGSGKPSITVYGTFTQPVSPSLPLTASLPDNAAPAYIFAGNVAVYVALSGLNTVGVLIPGQNTLTTQIPVGTTPVAIAGLPDQSKFYVANQGSNNVTVLKPDNSVLAVIPVGAAPSYIVTSADNAGVYVVNRGSNSVTVIDSLSSAAIATIPVGASPNFAVFDARNLRVYVTNSGGNTISVINADRNSPNYLTVADFTVGSNPVSLTVLADGTRLYVANSGSNSVSVLSGLSLAVQATITVPTILPAGAPPALLTPMAIASSPDSTKVVVAFQDNVAVTAADPDESAIVTIRTSDHLITRIPAPTSPACAVTTPAGLCRMKPVFVTITP